MNLVVNAFVINFLPEFVLLFPALLDQCFFLQTKEGKETGEETDANGSAGDEAILLQFVVHAANKVHLRCKSQESE